MTRALKTWLFEGVGRTIAEVCAMLPVYSERYIREALRDGCTSRADISRRYEDGMARYRAQMAKRPSIASRPIVPRGHTHTTALPDYRFRMLRT